jgi:hypothetical protein
MGIENWKARKYLGIGVRDNIKGEGGFEEIFGDWS